MKMHGRMRLATVLLLIGAGVVAADGADSGPPKVEPLKLLSRETPAWPGEINREAVVIIQFDVLATGKVANIHVADGGFHERRFVDAATNAVKRMKFEPRRIGASAVDTLGVTQLFKFSLGDVKPGITQQFRYELEKVGKLLDKKDYEGANFHAEWMLSGVVKLNYEYAVLQAQLAETYAKVGRTRDAIANAWRATARSAPLPEFFQVQESVPPNKASYYLLTKDLIVNLLELRMKLLARQGLYLEALQSYYELAGLVELKADDPRTLLAQQMTSIIQGSLTMRGIVEIGKEKMWRHHLSRRSFALDKVQGAIRNVGLRCSARELAYLEYMPGEARKTPTEWGMCSVLVEADPGTTFEVVEFPDTPAGAPEP
jgi:TonB family protein